MNNSHIDLDKMSDSQTVILKKNEYKCVELRQRSDGLPYIVKRYSGHPVENLIDNTNYIFKALAFFYQRFGDILIAPKPYAIDIKRFQVEMEYLPLLPDASLLSLKAIKYADSFFHRCYEIEDDQSFLRTIHGSVVVTPLVEKLLENRFPMRLGLKGDLKVNLCLTEDENLILADIDSIGLEPLGLSEIVLYAECFSSFRCLPTIVSLLQGLPVPIALGYLNRGYALDLVEAALEVMGFRMKHLPSVIQRVKTHVAKMLLMRIINSQFK